MTPSSNPEPSSPARRSKGARPTETRDRLLAAARSCVRDRGLQGTTSRDITTAAEANLAAITYHFGSKDELVAEALFQELEARLGPALDLLRSGGQPVDVMLRTVQRLTTDFDAHRADAPIYLEALVLASHGGPFASAARKLVRSVQRLLRDQITALVEAGIAPAWTDPEAMASLIIALANGVALQATIDPRGPAPHAIAGQFAGLLIDASRSPDKPS